MLIPNTPVELGLEGFDEWREHQQQTVQDISDAFETDDVLLVEAPTGSGKTIIGAAAARALGGPAVYLAHTIVLQNQQLRTLPGAVTVTGRRNHACELPVAKDFKLSAEDADCPCHFATPDGCSYYRQWFKALDAQDVVLNYAFIVRVVKAMGLKVAKGYGTTGTDGQMDVIDNPFRGRKLMVCDEGHNLEKALLDADTVDIYEGAFERYGIKVPRSVDFEDWPMWAKEQAVALQRRYSEQRGALAVSAQEGGITVDAMKDSTRIKSLLQVLANIGDLNTRRDHTPIYVGRRPHGFTMQPLWAWNRARHLLFNHAERTMIMSATLGSPGLTARLLGLDSWRHIKIPSTFPKNNRPVLYWPVSKMKYGMGDQEKQRQVGAMAHIARMFPNSRGVVHCNSYELGEYMARSIRAHADGADVARRVITHTAQDREATFELFESGMLGEDAILITPAATTGVDWDFVSWQQIPKVPYASLGDELTRLRYEYVTEEGEAIGKQVYSEEAAKTLVQAAGRCVRTPTSKGVTVITDGAFWALFKHVAPDAFPDWFREAVAWYEPRAVT